MGNSATKRYFIFRVERVGQIGLRRIFPSDGEHFDREDTLKVFPQTSNNPYICVEFTKTKRSEKYHQIIARNFTMVGTEEMRISSVLSDILMTHHSKIFE